jgi:DNA-directed RNA polymerase subunit RPC12/RpoP
MVKCNLCGGDMSLFTGITEDADYIECSKCGNRVYINEEKW